MAEIIEKNLSIKEVRYIKQNPDKVCKNSDISNDLFDAQPINHTNDENDDVTLIAHRKLLSKKVRLCFKVSLAKMDNLINTYDNLVGNDELNSSNVDEVSVSPFEI